MSTPITEVIEEQKAEANAKQEEIQKLQRLHAAFPDLQRYVGRWNKVAYYSKSVNARITDADIRHNCGCCNDSPLEVWPFIETVDGFVYSDPPCFTVGEKIPWDYGNHRPYDGWDEKMRAAGIPEALITKVRERYFHPEEEDDVGDDE